MELEANSLVITKKKLSATVFLIGILVVSAYGILTAVTAVGPKLALIDVEGRINRSKAEAFAKALKNAEEDWTVKAIVLNVNSGGGTAGASYEMYMAVNKTKKPVISYIGELGASGAYLMASASKKIVANPMAITGSIGVTIVFPIPVPYDPTSKPSYLSGMSSGDFKDMFEDDRLDEKERAYLREQLNKTLSFMLTAIAKGRNMTVSSLKQVSHGGWMSGKEALDYGLVDKLGSLEDAQEAAAEMSGIPLKQLRIERRRLEETVQAATSASTDIEIWAYSELQRLQK